MACALLASGAAAALGFVVEDIEIEGLRRVSAGQAFSGLSVQVGDYFNPDDAPAVMGELYRIGLFEDIVLRHDGGKLIFVVRERPGIAAIVIEGNEIIPDDALTEGLQEINIAIGRIYDRATFDPTTKRSEEPCCFPVHLKNHLNHLDKNSFHIQLLHWLFEGAMPTYGIK